MLKTEIDRFHDFTHTDRLKSTIKNEDFRHIIRRLADVIQYLENSTSNTLPFGIYDFDKIRLVEELQEITKYAEHLREVSF